MGYSNDRRSRDPRDFSFRNAKGDAGRPGRPDDDDPLAELARMIGRDDPFAVFDEPERRERSMEASDQGEASRPDASHAHGRAMGGEAEFEPYSRYEPLFEAPPAGQRSEVQGRDFALRGSLAGAGEEWQAPSRSAEPEGRQEPDFDFGFHDAQDHGSHGSDSHGNGSYGASAQAPIEDARPDHAHYYGHAGPVHAQGYDDAGQQSDSADDMNHGQPHGHQSHDTDRYAEPYMGFEGDVAHEPEADERAAARKAAPLAALRGASGAEVRRGGMVLVGAVAALAVLGGGATLAYRTFVDTTYQSGPPPVIEANVEPTKFAPDDPGGTDVPHQNKLIYDRVAGPGQDVDNVSLAPNDEEAGVDAASRVGSTAGDVIEPRRVRTVVVRPDGTIVQGEPGSAAQQAESGRVAAVPGETDATLREPAVPDTSAADLFSDEAMGAGQRETGAEDNVERDADGLPLPQRRPGEDDTSSLDAPAGSAQPQTAAASTGDAALPVTLAAASSAEPAGEGWGVQLASQRSEEQARSAYSTLQQRYGGVLGQREARYVRADLGERGVFYRVHVPAGSRDEAASLCSDLKSAGGDCLVQRN